MKSKKIAALALAAFLLAACAACATPNVLDSAPPPSSEPTASPSTSSSEDGSQTPDGAAPASYLADFSGKKIVFDGQELDASVLEFYYNAMVSDFLSAYYSMLDQVGLSLDVPFEDQPCQIGNYESWFDYFYDNAVYRFHSEYAINKDAAASGMSLTAKDSDDIKSILDSYSETYSGDEAAIDANLQERFGKNMSYELFKQQINVSFLATRWETTLESSMSFTDEQLKDSFASEEEFETYNYNMVSVRHILVSDEALADEVLAEWQKNPTEDNFAALVPNYTEDTGSSVTGGLYENIMKGDMVAEFENWCFDSSRKPGDTGIVQTDYGFHVMYFSSAGAAAWREQATYTLGSGIVYDKIEALRQQYPMNIE